MKGGKTLIEVNNLYKVYENKVKKTEALKGVDLKIKPGEIFGIIGLSGAGKSSLVRCLNLLEKPTSGTINIGKEEMNTLSSSQLREARRKIGVIFQHFNLLHNRTVWQNIAFPLEISGAAKSDIEEKVTKLLQLVGLQDKAHFYPAQLSGGQKQRVGIARALANEPKVLLCDEATSALDPETTKSILRLLCEINQQLQLTIVLITHEMAVIKEICDKVAVLEDGKIIEQGLVIDIFAHPQTATAKKFVSSTLPSEVPASFRSQEEMVRITFVGEWAGRPVISDLIRKLNLNVNILSGNIEYVKEKPFGILWVEIEGSEEKKKEALVYLSSLGLGVEVIKNV